MDGWETVHNHKKDKTKSRNSPGQKIGPSRLKNSRVTPNKQNAAKANQLRPNGVRTSGGLNRKKSPSDSNLHNKTIGSSQSNKSSTKTTDDREPERPVKSERCIVTALEQERLDNNNDIDSTVISVDAALEQTAEPQSEKRNAWVASGRQHSDPGAAPAVQNGGDVFVADEDIDLQIRTLRTLSEPGFNGHCDDLDENGLAYTASNGAEIAGNLTVDDDQTKDEGMGKKLKVIDDDEEEEDEDNRLEEEQEQAIQSAIKEEESYLKEIEEEENNVIAASIVDDEPENDGSDPLDWEGILAEDEARRNSHEILTWGDQVESEMDDSRTPGRCVHMHEKLSSPSRKRSIRESQKRHEEKQAKAEELREKQQRDKSERLKYLSNKVEEVRAHKLGLMQVKRETMEQKLARADSIRRIQIKNKVKKAHEEETKANEIAFINSLEALNKKHDIMSKHQESEARLHDIQEERQRKHEEKAAMEAKAAERRRNIEAERMNRIQEIQEKRKQREQVVEQRQQEKEKERLESAKAKEKDREQRIAALNAQQQAHIEELKHKIKHKQEESTRRHQEKLDEIREKAFEMSLLRHSTEDHNEAPKLTPYDKKKLCHVCNVLLPSEVHLLSHLRGRQHQQSIQDGNSGKDLSKQDIESFNLKNITNAPLDRPDPKAVSDRERQKAQKKRCKKLRQRMTQRGQEYEKSLDVKLQVPDSEHKAKIQKVLKDLCKYVQQQSSGPWPQNRVSALDRALGEISRILEKKVAVDQNTFRICGGIPIVCNILSVIENSSLTLPPVIPNKSLILACNVLRFACKGSYENCHYMLFSNKIALITDLLAHRLEILIPDHFNSLLESSLNSLSSLMIKLPDDSVSTGLMQVISTSLSCLAKKNPTATSSEASAERMTVSADAFINRSNDIISYLISVGVVDKLHQYFSGVREPIDDDIPASDFLTHSLALLCSMIRVNTKKSSNVFEKNCKIQDPTQLISTFSATELFGIVSLLYGMLLHGDAPSRRDTESPPELPLHTLNVTVSAIKMLNSMAALDLNTFQKSLGEEGTWLEYRHICSYLLWYCSHYPSNDDLQHEIILCVGYFTALNQDNQLFIQSGQPPTVLQQLCSLPFQYFSDPKLMNILYPTLIACCYDNSANRAILEHELSCELLANFLEEKDLECQQAKLTPSTNGKKTKSQGMGKQDVSGRAISSRLLE
ncbi:S phase cyclin A-associated protein in the endoplasmic reticulum-like isoform X2 [Tubulanus polymorphus]|uniref:S phase cyclin A-associated protein in the endoplasmic reticulum-like isoform X2 n=1 Tax=Tubulanus polymorphus TaxID=672921 RepID=UPI003DA3A1D8